MSSMSVLQNTNLRLGVVTVGAASAALLAVYAINHYRKAQSYWNSPYVEVGRVNQLFVYPIKSCKGVEASFVDCTVRGPRNGWHSDREFVVIDELQDGMFLTARTYPKLVLVEVERVANTLTVRFPNGRKVEVDLEEVQKRNDVRKALLHRETRTDGLDCGDEIGHAFTEYLELEGKRSLRLVRFSPKLFTERDQASNQLLWLNPPPKVQDHIAFADKTSYMINTTASVDDLNKRLEEDGQEPIDVRNFRPVISVAETMPYEEDLWLEVRIGDVEFACFWACSRCVLTTVNPDSGEFRKDMNPLKKLREYRLAPEGRLRDFYKQSPIFGVHLALKRPGRIHVGDTVYARRKPTPF